VQGLGRRREALAADVAAEERRRQAAVAESEELERRRDVLGVEVQRLIAQRDELAAAPAPVVHAKVHDPRWTYLLLGAAVGASVACTFTLWYFRLL
jgi:hypothetical protein